MGSLGVRPGSLGMTVKKTPPTPNALPRHDSVGGSNFFKRVERLAEEHKREHGSFHRTRAPFTRLQDVLGQIRAERLVSHPSHCHNPDCGKPLSNHYYRRAGGYAICEDCFQSFHNET